MSFFSPSMSDGPGRPGNLRRPRWAALLVALGLLACTPTQEGPREAEPAGPSLYLELASLKGDTVPKALISLSSGQRQLADTRGTLLLEKMPVGRQLLGVQAEDYFPTVLAFDMAESVQAGARLQLIPLGTPLRTFDASTGTTLSTGGVTVIVPPGALLDERGNPIEGLVDAFMRTLDLGGGELVAAPGALEGIPAPGAQPAGLESLGMVALVFQQEGKVVSFARSIGVRGSTPGIIRFGLPGQRPDSRKPTALSGGASWRVPAWGMDPASGRWRPTGEPGLLEESSTEPGRFDWSFTLDNPPSLLNVAMPFWWRSPSASRDNPLAVPEPRWAETACLEVRVLDDVGHPVAGRMVSARGVGYTGLSRALTNADGQARLEVMRNQAVNVDAGAGMTPVPPISAAGPCAGPEASPTLVELKVAARKCAPGAWSDCEYSGPPGTRGWGICRAQRHSCNVEGTEWSATCEGEEVHPQQERCDNALDDDCDGDTNETCATICRAAETRPCYDGPPGTEGVGWCQAGTQTCNGGTRWSTCSGQRLPVEEDCTTARDDNCDGRFNESPTCVWGAVVSMSSPRESHTATRLGNGKVLIIGGHNGTTANGSAELYDPANPSTPWSTVRSMTAARSAHTATLLGDGKVLVVGGYDGSNALQSAELYDPATDTWSSAGSMASPRYAHQATLLGNGKVLVTGGTTGSSNHPTAELYDPGSNTWSSAGTMASARVDHTATLLNDGKVLVVGGASLGALASAELYDPANTSTPWSSVLPMAREREQHTATLLRDGKVLVVGGIGNSGILTSAVVYDPANPSDPWSIAGNMAVARYGHVETMLRNGKVLISGGYDVQTAEVYDPANPARPWSPAGSMLSARVGHTVTLLKNDRVLVTGGVSSSASSSAELYSP